MCLRVDLLEYCLQTSIFPISDVERLFALWEGVPTIQMPSSATLHSRNPPLVTAATFVRKMKGHSQSILVEGTDRHLYVVKMHGNVYGSGSLASEFIGGYLCDSLGLSVAQCRFVQVEDRFLDRYPDAWFQTPAGRVRPPAGLHHGTAFIGASEGAGRPFHLLTGSMRSTVRNRNEFCGMYLFDIWANHLDRRQSLYTDHSDNEGIQAVFVDHGMLFCVAPSQLGDHQQQARHRRRDAVNTPWRQAAVRGWLDTFKANIPRTLEQALQLVPPEWSINSGKASFQAILLERLTNLDKLVEPFALKES